MNYVNELELTEEILVESDIAFEGEYVSGADKYNDGFADGEKQGYDNGYTKGASDKEIEMQETVNNAYLGGISEGKQAEYDRFWDTLQVSNGTHRTDYRYCFAGESWTDETFKPKYNINAVYCEKIFAFSSITNLKKIVDELGITLTLSNANANVTQMFQSSDITDVGEINFTYNNTIGYAFFGATKLRTIEKIKFANPRTIAVPADVFQNCKSLEEVRFEGVIGGNFNITGAPKLSVESAKDIINHLADYSGTDNEYKYTVYFASETLTKLEAEGNTAPNGVSWLEYIDIKGWNA